MVEIEQISKVIKRLKKMKNPRVIIIDEATGVFIADPTKYEILSSFWKRKHLNSGGGSV